MKLPTILEVDTSDRPGSISGDLYAVAAGAALGAYAQADPTREAPRYCMRARTSEPFMMALVLLSPMQPSSAVSSFDLPLTCQMPRTGS